MRSISSQKAGAGALLEVQADKICTTPARDSDLEVKICTTPARQHDLEVKTVKAPGSGSRTTF